MILALAPYTWQDTGLGPMWHPPAGITCGIDMRSIPDMSRPEIVGGCGVFGFDALDDVPRDAVVMGAPDDKPGIKRRSAWASMTGVTPAGDSIADWLEYSLTLGADPYGDTRCRPLLPDMRRRMRLHMGRASRARVFDANSEFAAPVLQVLREDYRALRAEVMAGRMREGQHLRVLKMWGEKFRIPNPEDVFVPGDLPKEAPLPHETTITESFNTGTSTTTLGPDLSWTEIDGNLEIVSDRFRPVGSTGICGARAESDLSGPDQYAQVDIYETTRTAGQYVGTLARKDSTGTLTYYLAIQNGGVTGSTLKCVANSFTAIGTNTTDTWSDGAPMKLECSGSAIQRYYNGASRNTATDTAITTGVRCGIRGRRTDGTLYYEGDDFEAADLAAGGATPKGWFGLALNGPMQRGVFP